MISTNSRCTSTCSGTVQRYNRLVRCANISRLDDVISQKSIAIFRATLDFCDLSFDSSGTNLRDNYEFKMFFEQSFPPFNVLLEGDFL